jgi:hypothetical protein
MIKVDTMIEAICQPDSFLLKIHLNINGKAKKIISIMLIIIFGFQFLVNGKNRSSDIIIAKNIPDIKSAIFENVLTFIN